METARVPALASPDEGLRRPIPTPCRLISPGPIGRTAARAWAGWYPDLPRPFRPPGYPVVPAVYLAGTGMLTAAVFHERPVVSTISLMSITAGVPVYYIWTPAARRRPAP